MTWNFDLHFGVYVIMDRFLLTRLCLAWSWRCFNGYDEVTVKHSQLFEIISSDLDLYSRSQWHKVAITCSVVDGVRELTARKSLNVANNRGCLKICSSWFVIVGSYTKHFMDPRSQLDSKFYSINSWCPVPHHTTQTVAPNHKIFTPSITLIWDILKEVRVSILYYVYSWR